MKDIHKSRWSLLATGLGLVLLLAACGSGTKSEGSTGASSVSQESSAVQSESVAQETSDVQSESVAQESSDVQSESVAQASSEVASASGLESSTASEESVFGPGEIGPDEISSLLNPEQGEAIVKIEELSYDIQVKDPDVLGNIYAETRVTNNSPYTLLRATVFYGLADGNMMGISINQTILPGETSAYEQSFADAGVTNDSVISVQYEVLEKDALYSIEYNYKTKAYTTLPLTITPYYRAPKEEVPANVDELPFTLDFVELAGGEKLYGAIKMENKSKHPITWFNIRALDKASGRLQYVAFFDALEPGATIESKGSEISNRFTVEDIVDVKYKVLVDGKEWTVGYDYKLGTYTYTEPFL